MGAGIGWPNLTAEGVANHINPVVLQTIPQRFKILDKLIQ